MIGCSPASRSRWNHRVFHARELTGRRSTFHTDPNRLAKWQGTMGSARHQWLHYLRGTPTRCELGDDLIMTRGMTIT